MGVSLDCFGRIILKRQYQMQKIGEEWMFPKAGGFMVRPSGVDNG